MTDLSSMPLDDLLSHVKFLGALTEIALYSVSAHDEWGASFHKVTTIARAALEGGKDAG